MSARISTQRALAFFGRCRRSARRRAPEPPYEGTGFLASSGATDCTGAAAAVPAPATIDATAHGSPLAGRPAAAPATVDADGPASLPDSPQGPALAPIHEAIVRPAVAASRYIVEATTGEGVWALPLEKSRLPWSVGRSRRSALIVPRIHEGVSGHHIDIVALDEEGAEVLVHGANGVRQGTTAYGAGERFHWRVGEVLEFGRASAQEPAFTLELFQHASAATVRE